MEDTVTDAGALTPEPERLAETPHELTRPPHALAEVVTARDGNRVEHELMLSPGATAADITAAMILMPPAATLVSHRGERGVSLVFREPTRLSAGAAVWPAAAGADIPNGDDN